MHEITVPKLNSNDESYILVEWLADDGEELAPHSPVAVVETSKTAAELVADKSGFLQRVVDVNAECGIGAVIGRLFPTQEARLEYLRTAERVRGDYSSAGDVVITTSAREAAEKLGVDLVELHVLGKKVLKRRDIEQFAARAPKAMVAVKEVVSKEEVADGGGIRLSAAQQAVGQTIMRSHQSIPAAFLVIKVPVDAALELQADLATRSQVIVGLPEMLIKAVAGLRERFPLFFGSYRRGGTVSLIAGAHAGITLDLGKGLYIPVIEHAERKSLAEIADILTDFRISALRGSFRERELAGGNITISLSNDADIVLARPVIFPGQTCMLCLCATQEELYRTDERKIDIRRYLYLGITYDHRVINGRDAALFLRELKCILAEPDRLSPSAGRSSSNGPISM